MKFFNRFAVSLLASVLCASTLFAMPVDAKKTTKRRQPTQAELAAAAALQTEICASPQNFPFKTPAGMFLFQFYDISDFIFI